MKVKATWRHVFNVTREVDVNEEEYEAWVSTRGWGNHDRDLAIAAFLDDADTEFTADIFRDWRIDQPLPSDFELQYSEVEDVVSAPSDSGAS